MSAIATLAALAAKLNDRLLPTCTWLIIAIVALLAVILISAVAYHYTLSNAVAWSEEGIDEDMAALVDGVRE